MPIDFASLLYLLQLLEPIFGGTSSAIGIVLQLMFALLDFGTFFLGFI